MPSARTKGLAIIGSTGSIGASTLEIVRQSPERFKVVSLAAGNNLKLLERQIKEFRPRFVSVINEGDAKEIKKGLSFAAKIGFGVEGACRAASFDGVDVTVSAISGAAGLLPTMSAIKAGKDIALANKETLVMAGPIVMKEVKRRRVSLMPIDSEHSAIFQALAGHRKDDVRRLILTASGGPFLATPYARLKSVTPEEALNHPRWSMGKKITIDSATLMNKGLEVIEARWLFDVPGDDIAVTIHPQSIVHSMVEYIDGSIVAQMGEADMKGPIAYALSYPERIDASAGPFDLSGVKLEFFEPDSKRFPCLGLAYAALKAGGPAPAALNAADEIAVEEFLKGGIRFTRIPEVVSEVMGRLPALKAQTIDDIIEADLIARETAACVINELLQGH